MSRQPKKKADHTQAHTELVEEVANYLQKELNLLFWKNPTGAYSRGGKLIAYGRRGSSDIIGCFRGRMVNIECKTGSGRLDHSQKKYRDLMEAEGGIYAVVRCWGDAKRLIACLRASLPVQRPLLLGYQPTPENFFRAVG